MRLVILNDGAGQASAYSLETLAGCAGHSSVDDFLAACRENETLLMETAQQMGEPFDREYGESNAASRELRQRLEARGYSAIDDPVTAQRREEDDREFESLLRYGQGEVLAQAGTLSHVKNSLTKSATAIAVAAMVAFGGLSVPNTAHADNSFERVAKDALGGAIGAGLLGQFGKGRGKTALQVVGAATGVVVAESLQHPQVQPNTQYQNTQYQNGMNNQGYPQNGTPAYGQPGNGMTLLSYDKQEKMAIQERNFMASRDAYARALYNAQQAEENRVLDPHNDAEAKAAVAAGGAVQVAGQRYSQVRSEFAGAFEILARNGYAMNNFTYAYSLAQKPVSARDLNARDLAAVTAPIQPDARPTRSGFEY